MAATLAARSLKGALWSVLEGVGVTALSFASFFVMARVLDAQDFGLVALAGVFVFFCNLVAGHCFADAIVQRRELDAAAKDTAFWGTIAVALILSVSLILGAELLADLFREPAMKRVLEVLALSIPLGAVGNISAALYRRDLRFRELALLSVCGRAMGALVGIGMAFTGMGLWSLVGQQVSGVAVTSVGVVIVRGWRPGFNLSKSRLWELGRFGSTVSAGQIVTGASEQLLNLATGALFGTTVLGYVNIAWRMVQLVRGLISGAMYHVGFSAFSRLQDKPEDQRRGFIRATEFSCLAGFLVAGTLVAVGDPLVVMFFGENWAPSILLLQILALELFTSFFAMFFSASYRALGRPEFVLWMSLAYLSTGLFGVLAFAWAGITVVVVAWAVRSYLLMPLHLRCLRAAMGISGSALLHPILPLGLSAAAMIVACRLSFYLFSGMWPTAPALIAAISIGAAVYFLTVAIMRGDLLSAGLRAAWLVVQRT